MPPARLKKKCGAGGKNSPSDSPRADVAAVAINVDDDVCAAPARSPAAEHPCQGHAADPASGAPTRSADEIMGDLPTRSPDETTPAASDGEPIVNTKSDKLVHVSRSRDFVGLLTPSEACAPSSMVTILRRPVAQSSSIGCALSSRKIRAQGQGRAWA